MKIAEALAALKARNEATRHDLATNAASDAVAHLIEHWQDAANNWGANGLDGLSFKRSFTGDLDDVINALESLREDFRKIVNDVPDDERHTPFKKTPEHR